MTDAPRDDTRTSPTAPPRRASTLAAAGTLLLAVLVGVGAGALIGTSRAASAEERAEDARSRASDQEDAARDRRDLLDARLELVDEQATSVTPVETDGALLAGPKSTTQRKFGEEFSVDGATYTVYGVEFVDAFDSAEEERPASEEDGSRWALVDVDIRNDIDDLVAPTCGTITSVRLIDSDGTGYEEPDFEPPVHPDSTIECGINLARGKSGRWVVPIRVPDDAAFDGVHVADVYARSSDSEFEVVRGTAAWIPFEDDAKPGKTGDDPVRVGPGREEGDS